MFGGKSEFVIENIITHNRFLYQIKQAQNNKNLYFVYAKQITTDTDEISKRIIAVILFLIMVIITIAKESMDTLM